MLKLALDKDAGNVPIHVPSKHITSKQSRHPEYLCSLQQSKQPLGRGNEPAPGNVKVVKVFECKGEEGPKALARGAINGQVQRPSDLLRANILRLSFKCRQKGLEVR